MALPRIPRKDSRSTSASGDESPSLSLWVRLPLFPSFDFPLTELFSGMSDNLTHTLVKIIVPAKATYGNESIPLVVKSVPYASVDQALPYLIRRYVSPLPLSRVQKLTTGPQSEREPVNPPGRPHFGPRRSRRREEGRRKGDAKEDGTHFLSVHCLKDSRDARGILYRKGGVRDCWIFRFLSRTNLVTL